MKKSSPKISIIIHGRDDEYVANFVEMLSFTVNFLMKGVCSQKLQERIELVLVDWGSEISFIPKILRSVQLDGSAIINGHYVDSHSVKKLDGDVPYHISKAVNFGMRRAKGEFLLVLSGNNLIPELDLLKLVSILDNRERFLPNINEIYGILPRRILPHPIAGSFSIKRINNYFNNLSLSGFSCNFKINSGGGGSGLLFQKSLIEKANGLSEQSGFYGWNDAEIFYRLIQFTDVIDLGNFGLCGFKFWRNNESPNISKRRLEFLNVRKIYPNYLKPECFKPNPEWGAAFFRGSVNYSYSAEHSEALDPLNEESGIALTNQVIFSQTKFVSLVKIYFEYRKSQLIAKKTAIYFKELIQISRAIDERMAYHIIMSTNSAEKVLYFLANAFPGISLTLVESNPSQCDAEEKFGSLAKRIKGFFHSRIKYIRSHMGVKGFLTDESSVGIGGVQEGVVILERSSDVRQNLVETEKQKTILETKNIQVFNLGDIYEENLIVGDLSSRPIEFRTLLLVLLSEIVCNIYCLSISAVKNIKRLAGLFFIIFKKN